MSFLLDTNAQATIITDGEDSRLERSSRQPTELLLNLGISLDEIEEELKPHPRIFVRGAGFAHNAELEQVLAKNSDVLQSLGISVDLARERLQSRVRIFVKGAGFVHNVRFTAFTDLQQRVQRILVKGAGFARSIGLTEMPTPEPTPSPTHTPTNTSTPTPTNTSTPTDTPVNTPTSTPVPSVTPTITWVRPNQGSNDVPNDITIRGSEFVDGARVALNTITLTDTMFIDAENLRAMVQAGLEPGVYDVTVTNPDGGKATLARAYTVFAPDESDLFGKTNELWTEPIALHAQLPAKLGLKVHRQGGKQVLNDVKVRFYLGDPNSGGTMIGDGSIPLLSPRSDIVTDGVAWTPPAEGDFTIYAIIDPDNAITETHEDNNTVIRTITVLPALPDQIAPRVDSFSINERAYDTTERVVLLDTTGSDPEPGSGVNKLIFIEYEFSQGANDWVRINESGWMDYDANKSDYPWALMPIAGMKYLQAWVQDRSGNVSLFPYGATINYEPPTDTVLRDQGRVYRYQLTQGQQMIARVEPVTGDPDLYVWAPDHETRPPWVSNKDEGVDEVTVMAEVSGTYQVEVYGFTRAEYRLRVTITGASGAADKPVRDRPLIPVNSEPGKEVAIPTAGQVTREIFLPLFER